MISKEVSAAEVSGTGGRKASFEVSIDGVLVYSKLEKGAFPNFDDVVAAVGEVLKGAQPSTCAIDAE